MDAGMPEWESVLEKMSTLHASMTTINESLQQVRAHD